VLTFQSPCRTAAASLLLIGRELCALKTRRPRSSGYAKAARDAYYDEYGRYPDAIDSRELVSDTERCEAAPAPNLQRIRDDSPPMRRRPRRPQTFAVRENPTEVVMCREAARTSVGLWRRRESNPRNVAIGHAGAAAFAEAANPLSGFA
jgi:hypothetical protein